MLPFDRVFGDGKTSSVTFKRVKKSKCTSGVAVTLAAKTSSGRGRGTVDAIFTHCVETQQDSAQTISRLIRERKGATSGQLDVSQTAHAACTGETKTPVLHGAKIYCLSFHA